MESARIRRPDGSACSSPMPLWSGRSAGIFNGTMFPVMSAPSDAPPAPYPADLAREITLRDGSRVRLRPIRPDDAPRLVRYYTSLSAHTAYQRFFTVMQRLP